MLRASLDATLLVGIVTSVATNYLGDSPANPLPLLSALSRAHRFDVVLKFLDDSVCMLSPF